MNIRPPPNYRTGGATAMTPQNTDFIQSVLFCVGFLTPLLIGYAVTHVNQINCKLNSNANQHMFDYLRITI